jgi:hypothetical protein
MNDHARDPLDKAIDHVAARLVSVEQDAAMVERLVAGLPERPARTGWFGVLVPQAAAAVAILVAVVMWTTRDRDEARDPVGDGRRAGTSVAAAPAVAPASVVAVIAKPRRPVVRRSLDGQLALVADHERGLDPAPAPIPFDVPALEALSTPEKAPLVVAPIVLTELPLSGESISPR